MEIINITGANQNLALSMDLRNEDLQEILTASGLPTKRRAMLACLAGSDKWTKAIIHGGECLVLFGLSYAHVADIGAPWCVCAKNMAKYKKTLHKMAKVVVDGMLDEFPILMNFIDTRNTAHIRWLGALGFSFLEDHGFETNGVWFQLFKKER